MIDIPSMVAMENEPRARREARASSFPAWARVLDTAIVAFLVLAASVAVFGGYRTRLIGVRFSLTSAPLLLLYFAATAIVRHSLVPREPVYHRLWQWARTYVASDAFAAAWSMFVTTRLAVLVLGYLAIWTIGYPPQTPPYRLFSNEVFNLPVRWDAGWYLGIANVGYTWDETALKDWRQQNVAFFPAFPLLMRAGGRLIGERPVIAGQLISLIAFLAALVYLYRLAREVLEHHAPASAIALLAAYPFAVFFSAIYTESLFLLSAVAAFYHFHRQEHGRAGAWGLVAGLSRPNGALLSVALAVLAVQNWQRESAALGRVRGLMAAAAPGVGMLLFSAYLFALTGRPFAWMEAHRAWGRTYHGLDWFGAQRFREFVDGFYHNPAALPIDVMNGAAVLLALLLVWPIVRRFGLAYGIFVLVNLIPPLFAGGLISMGRLTSVLFPTFLWLGEAIPASRRPAWVAAFGMGQALGAMLFFTWRPFY
ncbi:MAG: glycosyltransferase family 39 protein [Acidobacteria bacterium]|nr:glycosyltransferase family 39 protein [Acidobacteriota bacterium]